MLGKYTCQRFSESSTKEHFINITSGEVEKLVVAVLMWKKKHTMDHRAILFKLV